MIGRPAARRAPFSVGVAALIISCYVVAGIVAAVVPGLDDAGRTWRWALLLASLAGTAAWLAAPRLGRTGPAPVCRHRPWATAPRDRAPRRPLRFDRQLDRALDDADDRPAVLDVTARALETIPPGAPAELLLLGGTPAS